MRAVGSSVGGSVPGLAAGQALGGPAERKVVHSTVAAGKMWTIWVIPLQS